MFLLSVLAMSLSNMGMNRWCMTVVMLSLMFAFVRAVRSAV